MKKTKKTKTEKNETQDPATFRQLQKVYQMYNGMPEEKKERYKRLI